MTASDSAITPIFPFAKISECSTTAVLLFVILFTATEPLTPTPPTPTPAPIPIVLMEELALLFSKAFRTFWVLFFICAEVFCVILLTATPAPTAACPLAPASTVAFVTT